MPILSRLISSWNSGQVQSLLLKSTSSCLPISFSSRIQFNQFKILTNTMPTRPKVFITRSDIPKIAVDTLREKCDVLFWDNAFPVPRDILLKNIQGIDGLFCMVTDKIDGELLDKAGPNLKVIGTMSVGHDHIDVEAVKSRGIKLGFTPDVLTDATAELTVALLLATSRRLFEAHAGLLNGDWAKCAWGPTWMCGMGLANSTVGIYGMGRIGQAVMKRLVPFGVSRFVYSGRSKKVDVPDAEFLSFEDFLRQSDFIIVTCPLTEATKDLFGEKAFSLMKTSAVFVNTSRGGLVNQDALIAALKTQRIFAAGLDVMTPEPLPVDHELTKLKNCVLLPHIGSATIQSRNAMAQLTAKNILAGLEGTKLPSELC
jgi:glyoxylate/hydroxypyruvate reductase